MPIPHSTSKHFKPIGNMDLGVHSKPHLCSLQLLSPRKEGYPSDPLPAVDATALYIANLSETLPRLMCNEKDLSSPMLKKHLCPSMKANQDHDVSSPANATEDVDAHLAHWAKLSKTMPNYHAHIIDMVVEVHESGRKAQAWSFKKVSGLPGGVCKEAVALGKWERQGQIWVMTV